MKKNYPLEEIKRAFWKTFHESGELWFPYWEDSESENEEVTNEYWKEFLESLNRQPTR